MFVRIEMAAFVEGEEIVARESEATVAYSLADCGVR